jgi:hypothetical protein
MAERESLSTKGFSRVLATKQYSHSLSYRARESSLYDGGRKALHQRLFAGSCDEAVLSLAIVMRVSRQGAFVEEKCLSWSGPARGARFLSPCQHSQAARRPRRRARGCREIPVRLDSTRQNRALTRSVLRALILGPVVSIVRPVLVPGRPGLKREPGEIPGLPRSGMRERTHQRH